jgi:hypothetical protein
LYGYLADLVVVLHSLFVLFVVLGGFLVFWKVKTAYFHMPAVLWAAVIEFMGWICPLTPLENILRQKGGITGYETGFVEHYIVPVLYPEALTRQIQITLGVVVIILNAGIYLIAFSKVKRNRKDPKRYNNDTGASYG